jgi:hypothetical protein
VALAILFVAVLIPNNSILNRCGPRINLSFGCHGWLDTTILAIYHCRGVLLELRWVMIGLCYAKHYLTALPGLTNTLLFIFTRHSLIQRVTRHPQIRITTHQLTVTDAGQVVPNSKSFPLDEFDLKSSTPTAPASHARLAPKYSVQFDAESVGRDQKVDPEEIEETPSAKSRRPFDSWARS